MAKTFLTAEWRKLIMANYAVAEEVLLPYLPSGTNLDRYAGHSYVSLVGFLFQNTRLKSIPVPFHRTFEEVNLRFYVTHTTASGERRRGVVFIRELVPRLALAIVARSFYGENYATVPMSHQWINTGEQQSVEYSWSYQGRKHKMQVAARLQAEDIEPESAGDFFTEHYWGYTKQGRETSEYAVLRPRWKTCPILHHSIDVDFGTQYGSAFASLSTCQPASVLLAEGSVVEVRSGKRLALG